MHSAIYSHFLCRDSGLGFMASVSHAEVKVTQFGHYAKLTSVTNADSWILGLSVQTLNAKLS